MGEANAGRTGLPSTVNPARKRILFNLNNPHHHDDEQEDDERSNKKPIKLLNLIEPLLLPWEMKRKIQDEMGGFEIKLLLEKQLFPTDLCSKHNRFSIPINKISKEFLREEEKKVLETRSGDGNKLGGIRVKIVDPCLREYDSLLEKWAITSPIYNLTHQWISVVQDNQFQCDDAVQLWSFRVPHDELCFALVVPLRSSDPSDCI